MALLVFLFIVAEASIFFCPLGWHMKDFKLISFYWTKVLRCNYCYYNVVWVDIFVCSFILQVIGSFLDCLFAVYSESAYN